MKLKVHLIPAGNRAYVRLATQVYCMGTQSALYSGRTIMHPYYVAQLLGVSVAKARKWCGGSKPKTIVVSRKYMSIMQLFEPCDVLLGMQGHTDPNIWKRDRRWYEERGY